MMIVHRAYALMEELVMTELIATRVHVFKDSMDLTVLRVRLSYSYIVADTQQQNSETSQRLHVKYCEKMGIPID